MSKTLNDKIANMKIIPLSESRYIKPMRAEFQINGKLRFWDFVTIHNSVSTLIYNTSRQVLVFVRQFRPAMYLANVPQIDVGALVDTSKFDLSQGYSLELCAGLVDKEQEEVEIARDEVLEECGYEVPVSNFRKLFSFRGVGISGQVQTLYYVEVTDGQKISSGGGLREEGEFIEVVDLSIEEVKQYLDSKDLLSPPSFFAAVQWFFHNKVASCIFICTHGVLVNPHSSF